MSWFYSDFFLWVFYALADLSFFHYLLTHSHMSKVLPFFKKHIPNVTSWVNYFSISSHFPHSNVYVFQSIGLYFVHFCTLFRTLYKILPEQNWCSRKAWKLRWIIHTAPHLLKTNKENKSIRWRTQEER